METLEAIRARHSVRDYTNKPVEREKILAILDAASRAPSGMNRQPWHFLVLTEEESRKKALSANSIYNSWMNKAPVLIVALADSKAFYGREEQKTYLFDVGLAVENLLLAATELGLGACVTIGFSAEKLQRELNIPERYIPIVLISVGYESKEKIAEPLIKGITHSINKKKNFDEVVSFERI
ncbi:MAG: nitroreductase family protein [Candidatus Bilamarchaeaceae archaeon]